MSNYYLSKTVALAIKQMSVFVSFEINNTYVLHNDYPSLTCRWLEGKNSLLHTAQL